jgi:integrase
MKLDSKIVKSKPLPAGKSEAIFFDDDVPGFGVRVREGGSRGFVFQYKVGAKQRRIALGSVAAIDLSKARDTAKDLYARVRLGEDPAGDKAVAQSKAAETFKAGVDLYLAHQRRRIETDDLRQKTYTDLERNLLTHAKALHGLQLAKIERRDIAACIAAAANKSGDVTSNRVRTSLSGFFSWAMGEGLVDQNPVIGTNRKEEKARKRVLNAAELRTIWNALVEDDHYSAILKLLALLGQREGEIAGLRLSELWEIEIITLQEIDGVRLYDVKEVRNVPPSEIAEFSWTEVKDGRQWPKLRGLAIVLPGERTKNKQKHLVPLPDSAREIIAAVASQQRVNADGKPRDLIFGYGDGPFSGWSKSKEALDARIAEAGSTLPHGTVHDLRRSFSTHAAEIGIEPHIIEAVINHVSGHKSGVAGTYNRARYEPAKRNALIRWANHLLALVEGRESNVTSLRRA